MALSSSQKTVLPNSPPKMQIEQHVKTISQLKSEVKAYKKQEQEYRDNQMKLVKLQEKAGYLIKENQKLQEVIKITEAQVKELRANID